MDSRYRKFLALVETGSFSAAARSLHVTQPAVSLAVTSLEHGLGKRLYVRRTRPITLTPEGQVVVEAARRMLTEHERMLTVLRDEKPATQLRIGLIDSIAHLIYASDGGQAMLSNAEVSVDNSQRILRDVRKGRLDVGVITGQPGVLGADIVVHKLHDEAFVFVAAPGRVTNHKVDRIDDWLATNPDSTTYELFWRLFQKLHLKVTPVFHSASMEILRDMAVSGKGAALLPRHLIEHALCTNTLLSLGVGPLYRPIWAITYQRTVPVQLGQVISHLDSLLASS